MPYQPGTHLIASLQSEKPNLLMQYTGFRDALNKLVDDHALQKLGEVYHNFEPAGFTAVICLSESHISIHTWPEHGFINLDIYLSNFERNNDGTVLSIFESLQKYFGSTIISQQTIIR
ncbi:MAG: adenosylmethionine decarboxylase [Chitinophagaceae bacterium]